MRKRFNCLTAPILKITTYLYNRPSVSCIYLSVYTLYLPICLSVCLYIKNCICLLSVYLAHKQCICLSVCLHV